jgi:uncharacterized protein YkwD
MMRRIIILALAFMPLLLLAATCAPPEYANTSWAEVQKERERLGLAALQWDDGLAAIASARTEQMTNALRISHDGSTGYFRCVGTYDYIGEVVGRQPLWEKADAVWWGWQNSPGHYHAVTLPQFKYGAIIAYVGGDGWVYEALWMSSVKPDCP